VAEATVVLGTSGEWNVVGMCHCSFAPAEQPEPTEPGPLGNPLEGFGAVGTQLPVPPSTPRSTDPDKSLVTPPIHVRVS
jgi:hypothetical protein